MIVHRGKGIVILSICVAASESLVEWKNQEETKEKMKYLGLGIFFVTVSIVYLLMKIHDFLEVG